MTPEEGADRGPGSPMVHAADTPGTPVDGAIWRLAQALAGAVDPGAVAEVAAEHGAAAAAATLSNIALLDRATGRVRVVHRSDLDASIAARWSELDPTAETPLSDAITGMVPVLLPAIGTIGARYPALLDDTIAVGLAATASWPLRGADGAILGAVGFGWSAPQVFDPTQCLGLSLIADLTAQALDRSLTHAELSETARRVHLLQRLTEHFASASTAQDIAEIAVAEVAPLVGATVVNVTRVDGDWIEHVANTQLPDWLAQISRRPLSDRVPSTDAARTGRPVVFPTHADLTASYHDAAWLDEFVDAGPIAAFPAIVNDVVVGTLALVFPKGVELSEEDVAFLATICNQCGQALERVDARDGLEASLADETRRALLAEATSDLAVSLSVTDSLRRLAHLVVPDLADWVAIDLADDEARPHQVAMLHRDGHHETIERFSALQPKSMTDQAPIMQVLATGEPIMHADTSIDMADAFVSQRELLELCDVLGICSVMYVPMVARGRTLGCLTLVSGVSGRHYDEPDLQFAMGLAQRAALVVDNSTLYEREHHIANVLQASLLPAVPVLPGLDIGARYRPSDTHTQVGGDFYDVLPLPDGSVAMMVGDVMGHDLVTAATMGQLRGHLRACAWESAVDGAEDPGAVLDRTDRLVQGLALTELATALFGRIEEAPGEDGGWTLTYATAGHPAPLLRGPDGRTRVLDGYGMAIGFSSEARRRSHVVPIPAGSVLVVFSDGLVESRSHSWDEGLDAVIRSLAEAPPGASAEAIADLLLDDMDELRSDDTVVLVIRFS